MAHSSSANFARKSAMTNPASVHTRLGLPIRSRIILAAGEFTPGDGMRMAAWAFGILKYVASG